MPERHYLSIGEVLLAVREEFPDISISKIRFLEAEGLIEPERTPSGYRKFYERDVERLKAILRLQRDEYLPLKVIKERIETEPPGTPLPTGSASPVTGASGLAVAAGAGIGGNGDTIEAPVGLQMSIEEISGASGVEIATIRELESFGIVCAHGPDEVRYYDGEDFVVLRIVRDLLRYGIEPRHLAMYKRFAEREADFLESVVLPQTRQRSADARRAASTALRDLATTTGKLKAAFLRATLARWMVP